MTNSIDILNLALAVSAVSIAVFINLVLFNFSRTINSVRAIIENFHSITADAVNAKENAKLTVLKGVNKFLSFIPHKK